MNEVRFDEYTQQAIIAELRAIKATLSAIAIKIGALEKESGGYLVSPEFFDEINKSKTNATAV